MQGLAYLIAAYAIVWLGLCIYLAVVMLRIRGVRTELAAVEELVRERSDNLQLHDQPNQGDTALK